MTKVSSIFEINKLCEVPRIIVRISQYNTLKIYTNPYKSHFLKSRTKLFIFGINIVAFVHSLFRQK